MQKKILIVDDEDKVLFVVEKRLAHAGYTVIQAKSGQEGLELAKKEKPDLIIMDIMMPGMTGVEAVDCLKKDPETKNIPTIFLTALFTKEDERRGKERGDSYFIAKPYNAEKLLEIVKEHIE
ncbi:MAG: response regulator [Candidatus Omnitrophica bacterium]|nr:response regulator [Candidatus Omnitrophota bacterium]